MYSEPPSNLTREIGKCLSSIHHLPKETPRVSLLMELTDGVGILHDVLRFFWKYDVNVSRIESRPVDGKKFDFFVDFDGQRGDQNVEKLLSVLRPMTEKLLVLDEKEVS
jgi:prephenate dehydratase